MAQRCARRRAHVPCALCPRPDGSHPQGWSSWFELFLSSRECAGFPFLHRDMCSTHAFSMQIEGASAPALPAPARRPSAMCYPPP